MPSIGSSRIIKQFMKELFRTFPPVRLLPPEWHLNIVLSQLMKAPFEPIHRAELKYITWKVATLLALTSTRRVSDIQAFTTKEPFFVFSEDFIMLRTNPKYIPKVPSSFHLNEPVILRTFFPNPNTITEKTLHSLDIKRCLKFYLQSTKQIRKSDQLLVSYSLGRQGAGVTKATIAQWISSTIQLCHTKSGRPLTRHPRAHSTRAVSTSSALFQGIALDKICQAATWKTMHSFTQHYCLESSQRTDSLVGQAVLRHLFH
ncbi:hypothetical protein NDU88_004082 [Pleurodeles waltl]|uniref:Tyr recombinase domain-containing protein n=1 Tax=Pleurodeles waltl TaxID=8319 RepID=A0AAV7LIW2_PLEWA|nr:hypothetical protein NDU88_004082 [Pleurodeles waltl]